MDHLASHIRGTIDADTVQIGRGVVVEEGALITGKGGPAQRVVLGDFSFVGRNTVVRVPDFRLGDYTKLNAYSFLHGKEPMAIGRNCWIGGHCVLDSQGGLTVADNVGIGAQSQVWTHIAFGDIVEGSRFHSTRPMHLGEDSWLVGHCILSPVRVGDRSMALVGSVVTRDMEPNHVYAGVPAKDVTDKVGPQFERRTLERKVEVLAGLIAEFEGAHPTHRGRIRIAQESAGEEEGITYLDPDTRTYRQTLSQAEVTFFQHFVPLVKFVPEGAPAFVTPCVEPWTVEGDGA
jgi:acetyltransferase-like isoleucine patch superfamily enzyme